MARKRTRRSKRKLPAALKHTRACALQVGVKPFKKWTAAQKRRVKACVMKKTR